MPRVPLDMQVIKSEVVVINLNSFKAACTRLHAFVLMTKNTDFHLNIIYSQI